MEEATIEARRYANEGILLSIHNALVYGGLISLSVSGVLALFIGGLIGIPNGIKAGIAVGVLAGLIGGLGFGGGTVNKHYTLRLLLWLAGAFPWNITAFLDSCAQRRLVQRVGGGWRFPHNLIRDYFAELEIDKENIAEVQK